MKNIILGLFCLSFACMGYGQFIEPGRLPVQSCHVDVNTNSDFRDDLKRAIFSFNAGGFGNCSATLINRKTSQDQVGQYFITAWHCFKQGSSCDGSTFDFNNGWVTMRFNYQSPNGQSLVFDKNKDGQLYEITRRVRLVEKVDCYLGDFALCEILGDPIPPHFNVYYAGWYPTEIGLNANGEFAAIHHPHGTIKKISAVDHVWPSTNVVKTTCQTVTKVIDILLGWIWKRRWSTQVICTYTQVPYYGTKYKVSGYNYGTTEEGSSGGGFFTGERGTAGANRLVGQLSAAWPDHECNTWVDPGITYFGKLSDAYYRQSVKNALNPDNDPWIDNTGMGGTKITCYPQITINGGSSIPSALQLYPANTYQPQNAVTLTAQTNFVTNQNVIIKTGADFTFRAGQNVDLNPGFDVEPGANFTAEVTPSPCSFRNQGRMATNGSELKEALKHIPVPQEKKFEIAKYLPAVEKENKTGNNVNAFNVYPNPSKGIINVDFFLSEQEKNVSLDIYDLYGRHILSKKYTNTYFIKEQLVLPASSSGMYNLIIRTISGTFTKRIVRAN